jgi:alkylation response protein AidB-like acyl-CoA dehydrogenase
VNADDLRASADGMRDAVREEASTGSWTGTWGDLVRRLVDVARIDLCLARLVEGHADAMRILDQAGAEPRAGVYAVWASRSAGTGLRARRTATGWQLSGELRFASGVDVVDRALVPGWVDERTHLLFDVDAGAFEADRSSWRTTAMDASRSFTVEARDLPVDGPVAGENFYLERAGFVAGGLGPAAVWVGGARAVVDLVARGLGRFKPTAHQLRRLGAAREAWWLAELAVTSVASALDAGHGAEQVASARNAAAVAGEHVVDEAGRIVGPGGLTGDERLARTLADLLVYVRQHHLDLTMEASGRSALADPDVRG